MTQLSRGFLERGGGRVGGIIINIYTNYKLWRMSYEIHGLYVVHAFQPKSEKNFISSKNDIIGKDISRGVEWYKFQHHSTFQ